ncbi:tRNA-splicing endonuclease subunit tsp-like protein [Emericellopsis cladophorae]|uniref:tRNA-splicing endonuclease subunit tsp-like protein n=1 Tax=Emericellopsis cladophorae TaxID=2686198 RepID=A0A9Q0BDW1_9HYPO|nr:tRNA-splicing endonuclease subunit tsp-like protein [Emericellopsis cladophorae]KAI6781792.1 tRNA-splicing endonuclease subunit tsp-like protein [Emericellopsis cladophorae]
MAFDDDDSPSSTRPDAQPATAEEALEDEDVPDFKHFAAMFASKKGVSSKAIRKGEKDFESHGTRAQDSALEASRSAMEDVLSYARVHRRDTWVRGWFFPDRLADSVEAQRIVAVEHEKGSWVRDIGKVHKDAGDFARLWLLPEEALYLVERGTLDLWWPDKAFEEIMTKTSEKAEGYGPDDYDVGLPMSLEAAYAMLLGEEGDRGKVSMAKFQVYSHLKRGGFHILRAPADLPPPEPLRTPAAPTLWQWLVSLMPSRTTEPAGWGPLVRPGLYRAYKSIYQQLDITPRHKPVVRPTLAPEPQDPFNVFFHVWKSGGAPFSKKTPPWPDFRIAVSDTSSSHVPTLEELDALWLSSAPYDPSTLEGPGRMYQRLRQGHRNILVAVVDRGLVNFIRFGEGAFGEEPLVPRFDAPMRGGRKGGGGRGGRGGRGRGRGRGRR